MRPHDLRHTAVELGMAAGANPLDVAARAGHTSVSFTLDRYGHRFDSADELVAGRLDALCQEAQGAASVVAVGPRRPA